MVGGIKNEGEKIVKDDSKVISPDNSTIYWAAELINYVDIKKPKHEREKQEADERGEEGSRRVCVCVCVYVTDSPCCTAETNAAL